MRESRTPGSVRGDRGNPVPYRVRVQPGSHRIVSTRETEPYRTENQLLFNSRYFGTGYLLSIEIIQPSVGCTEREIVN